jgi:hypothetical protein
LTDVGFRYEPRLEVVEPLFRLGPAAPDLREGVGASLCGLSLLLLSMLTICRGGKGLVEKS